MNQRADYIDPSKNTTTANLSILRSHGVHAEHLVKSHRMSPRHPNYTAQTRKDHAVIANLVATKCWMNK